MSSTVKYPRKCTLRQDKGPEDATSLEQILQTANLTEIMKTLSERAKRKQPSLFEDSDSASSEFPIADDDEALSFEKPLPVEPAMQQNYFNKEDLIQLPLGLYE